MCVYKYYTCIYCILYTVSVFSMETVRTLGCCRRMKWWAAVRRHTWVVLVVVQVIVASGARSDVKSQEQFVSLQKRNSTVLCLLCHVMLNWFKHTQTTCITRATHRQACILHVHMKLHFYLPSSTWVSTILEISCVLSFPLVVWFGRVWLCGKPQEPFVPKLKGMQPPASGEGCKDDFKSLRSPTERVAPIYSHKWGKFGLFCKPISLVFWWRGEQP